MAHPGDELRSQQEIANANQDKSVTPYVGVVGMMTKTSGANWVYLGSDANFLRVSSIGSTASPLSADSSSVSAKQGDAGLLRVSAIITTTPNVGAIQLTSPWVTQGAITENNAFIGDVSAVQGDASMLRVSTFGAAQMSYYYLSATGIQTIKASPGFLHTVVINTKGTASTLKLFDNTSAASGLQIASIDTTISDGSLLYDVKTVAGLTVSTAGTPADITISYY